MKSIKLREQWRRFFYSQLENVKVAEEALDVEERYFLEGIARNYKEPLFERMCDVLLNKYNSIIDTQLNCESRRKKTW